MDNIWVTMMMHNGHRSDLGIWDRRKSARRAEQGEAAFRRSDAGACSQGHRAGRSCRGSSWTRFHGPGPLHCSHLGISPDQPCPKSQCSSYTNSKYGNENSFSSNSVSSS